MRLPEESKFTQYDSTFYESEYGLLTVNLVCLLDFELGCLVV